MRHKGNLRNTKGLILNINSRDRSGRIVHKSKFSIDDDESVQNEIRNWMRCLGIKKKVIKHALARPIPMEDIEIIKEQIRNRKAQEKIKDSIKKDAQSIKKLLQV